MLATSSTPEFAILSWCATPFSFFQVPGFHLLQGLKLCSVLPMSTGSADIFPVGENHVEAENENGSSNSVRFSMSRERRKTEMEIRKFRKMKIEARILFFNMVGKTENENESSNPMTLENGKRKWKFEFRFPMPQENCRH